LRSRKIPVLALVTDTESLFRNHDRTLDGCQYLVKPFSALAVAAWVQHAAENCDTPAERRLLRPRFAAALAVAGLALMVGTVTLGLLLPGRQQLAPLPRAASSEATPATNVAAADEQVPPVAAAQAAPAPEAPAPGEVAAPESAPEPAAQAAPAPAVAAAPEPAAPALSRQPAPMAEAPVMTFVPRVMAPTATAVSLIAPDPVDRVRLFYQYLQGGEFENMGWLLSERFKSTMPWDPKVLRERTPPGQINIEEIQMVSVDPPQLTATVAVRVVEKAGPPLPSLHTYAGTWKLVRGPSGWLMDQPELEEE
jgi:hypothetical protein